MGTTTIEARCNARPTRLAFILPRPDRDLMMNVIARATTLWGGLFEVKGGARTGVHHHGEQQTIAYVLSGVCEVRWGANGQFTASAGAGDFIHVPAFLPHMEINPSETESFHWVVVRSTATPIVVNLPDDIWPAG